MCDWFRRLVGGPDPAVTDGRPVFIRCNEQTTHKDLAVMVMDRDLPLSQVNPACRTQVTNQMMRLLGTPKYRAVHYDE